MADAEVRFHPEAKQDFVEAFGWYADRETVIADGFETDVEQAIADIREAPRRWRAIDSVHRRIPLRRFPYAVIYREHAGVLWIVAVAHGHRRPGFWQHRRVDQRSRDESE